MDIPLQESGTHLSKYNMTPSANTSLLMSFTGAAVLTEQLEVLTDVSVRIYVCNGGGFCGWKN